MSRTELAALSEGQSVCPVALTQAEAAALNRSKLVTALPEGDSWRVTAEYAVGAVRIGDFVVRVIPKVGVVKVLTLLARAYGVAGLKIDPSTVELGHDADLSSVLAVLFAMEVDRAMAGGPLRGYRTEDQTLPVLRGRLRIRDQYLRRYGVLSPLEVTFDEWTLDTDENRRIRAASQQLLDLPDVPQRARVGLTRLDRLLSEVWVAPRGAPLAGWTPTRLNVRLHRLLHLADLVIAHTSVEHSAGSTQTHGFVLNLAWLFEKLVARLLWERYPNLVSQKTFDLDGLGGLLSIQPDLVFNDFNGDPLAVADTKYKLLGDKGKISNDDAYQLVTYCGRLGLSTGHLIYAAGEPGPEPFNITGTQVSLVIHRIDLGQDVDHIESQVAGVLDKILPPQHAEVVA